MMNKEKDCTICLNEDRCPEWPPEMVCENWRSEPAMKRMSKSNQLKEYIEAGINKLGQEDTRFLSQMATFVKRYLENKEKAEE